MCMFLTSSSFLAQKQQVIDCNTLRVLCMCNLLREAEGRLIKYSQRWDRKETMRQVRCLKQILPSFVLNPTNCCKMLPSEPFCCWKYSTKIMSKHPLKLEIVTMITLSCKKSRLTSQNRCWNFTIDVCFSVKLFIVWFYYRLYLSKQILQCDLNKQMLIRLQNQLIDFFPRLIFTKTKFLDINVTRNQVSNWFLRTKTRNRPKQIIRKLQV